MDQQRFPEEREKFRAVFHAASPNLGSDYEILEPRSARYNCIAYSLGTKEEWVQPETGTAESPLKPMDFIYGEHTFQRASALTFDLQPGVQKVVVFAIIGDDQNVTRVTHAAVQDSSGTWVSKVGQGPLIRHRTPEAVAGPLYGRPVAVYVRKR